MIAFDAEPRFAIAIGPNGRRLVAEIRKDDARFRRRIHHVLIALAILAIAVFALPLNAWIEVRLKARPIGPRTVGAEHRTIGRALEQAVRGKCMGERIGIDWAEFRVALAAHAAELNHGQRGGAMRAIAAHFEADDQFADRLLIEVLARSTRRKARHDRRPRSGHRRPP